MDAVNKIRNLKDNEKIKNNTGINKRALAVAAVFGGSLTIG